MIATCLVGYLLTIIETIQGKGNNLKIKPSGVSYDIK